MYVLDLLVRRKKWNQNSKQEKISLVLSMIFVVFYLFTAVLGMLWGIAGGGADTAFGQALYDVTLVVSSFNWLVGLVATIGSLVLRKKEKIKASIWIQIIAVGFIIVVFLLSSLAGAVL